MSDLNKKRNYDILWDMVNLSPSIQLKLGVKRKVFPLTAKDTGRRDSVHFVNNFVELKGKWENSPKFGSLLKLKLKNITDSSIRLTRLVFPAENGLDDFLKNFNQNNISFLRNGYQSWSTARSHRVKDKPLRPWLQLVSLASSNMANLPSNSPGILSSEMFSIISDLSKGVSFLVGQSAPFNQFFYVRLNLHSRESKTSNFELVYDFGRKMIESNETIDLDGIVMAKGKTCKLQSNYFSYLEKMMKIKQPKKNIKGWSSWYCFYDKVTPDDIYKTLKIIKEKNFDFDYIQLDDGYQKDVGSWLKLNDKFEGKIKELVHAIKDAGFKPGIWLAPFIAESKSELIKLHPEYILKNEYGRPIIAGYNPSWNSRYYYGLDVTYPRFKEHIQKVISTIVNDWGFEYLKLDFLFGGCLRGGAHHNLSLSRTEVLKYGIKKIREAAGKDIIISGCGMPLSSGIGLVDTMRVGPDTAPVWRKLGGVLLRTGAMLGARNSIRNFLVRSGMNKNLWLNDPDCIMLRDTKTKLSFFEKFSQINAIILSGGVLMYSDDFTDLSDKNISLVHKINKISDECFNGIVMSLDIMEKELPELVYNSAGFLGVFNFKNKKINKVVDFSKYSPIADKIKKLQDVWSLDTYKVTNNKLEISNMQSHSSVLLRIVE